MKKLFFLSVFYICALPGVYGQVVSIGEDVSNLELKNVWNYPLPHNKLGDLKGKLVILDFWGFGCPGCIKGFPKMEELQAKYKDKIQVILVNSDSKEETQKFFLEKRRFIKKPSLPMISGDTVLDRSFPHYGVPFHVWIDGSIRARHFTYGYNTSIETVGEFLNRKKMNFLEYNRNPFSKPLFSEEWQDFVQYSAVLTKFRNGALSSQFGKKKVSIVHFSNKSVLELYQLAYSEGRMDIYKAAGRTIMEFIDSSKYIRPKAGRGYDEWCLKNAYSYELVLPKSRQAEKFELMKSDLSKYFDIVATVEDRPMNCLILVRTSRNDKLKTAGDKKARKFYIAGYKRQVIDSVRYVRNLPFNEFISTFSQYIEYNFEVPFVNEANYIGNVDIAIDGTVVDSLNLDLLRESFKAYDLDLIVGTRPVKVLVLKDRQKK
jgi:thiol-disulfide isomerase/thioredoxin